MPSPSLSSPYLLLFFLLLSPPVCLALKISRSLPACSRRRPRQHQGTGSPPPVRFLAVIHDRRPGSAGVAGIAVKSAADKPFLSRLAKFRCLRRPPSHRDSPPLLCSCIEPAPSPSASLQVERQAPLPPLLTGTPPDSVARSTAAARSFLDPVIDQIRVCPAPPCLPHLHLAGWSSRCIPAVAAA